MQEEEKVQNAPRKKSNWFLWVCGLCGCLVIILVIGLFLIFFARGVNFGSFFGREENINNGASPDVEDKEMTKEDLVDYFVQEVTTYPGIDRKMKLARWDKEIVTVSIEDDNTEDKKSTVDNFITIFNKNSTRTKLKRIEKNGDIKVYFQASTQGTAGKSGPSSGADFIIDKADIKISQEAATFSQSLNSVFAHEMFHALGFTGHYEGNTCRLMSSKTCGSRLTINEERLIKMLYSTDIPDGFDESQIRTYFANWKP